ncbi:GNAT family N-acetyltransferase [Rhizobacter sp. AJA081-3]|uniref:GNAT family N-acetyltransferase n=1 Tax=Rhizobacter sp. AJA081-3 TaxID=2753607 RepID=UPI001ADED36B|nr:GNAT family protein [Rhizobacter sp. AJA081-3]QTN21503.1 GNAT family N-acetyltransferase [Rhizobacter sp. AJA081-3]
MPPFDRIELQTERLLLRPLEPADAPALLSVFSDKQVMRYWGTPWSSIEEAEATIARHAMSMAEGEDLRLGVERIQDGALLGTCSLFDRNEECRRAVLDYALGLFAWRQGYMNEALTALLSYGFSQMKLNRVEAGIDPRNVASSRTLERLGFQKEGHLRERWIANGEFTDFALYGLLRREWNSINSRVLPSET